MPAKPGHFITLEGGEGVGKSTQLPLLAEALRTLGLSVLTTREPGGAPGAELLRGMLLRERIAWSPLAETLLHFAARAEHVAKTIRPALAHGEWVVCDRFSDSTLAYQGAGQQADQAAIETLIGLIGLTPDLTIVLDLPEHERFQRLEKRDLPADRYEALPADFHARVNAAFRAIAATHPQRCVLLPATGTPEDVHQRIMEVILRRLQLA